MNVRTVVRNQLESAVAEHSPMPFPENIDDDDELDVFGLDSLAFMELLIGIEKDISNPTLIISNITAKICEFIEEVNK